MKQFGLSLFSVGISARLMTMLLLLMIMSSFSEGIDIIVKANEKIMNESNQITVEVRGSTTVQELKKQIQKDTAIPPIKQTYRLNQNAPVLKDTETMTDYGIEDRTIILLFIQFEIKVKADRMITMFCKTFPVEVNQSDKVEDLKKNIIGTMEKKTKTNYENVKKISLQYGANDAFLNDGKTIGDYQIKKGDTVHLSIGEFAIVVRYEIENEMKNYTIWVKSEETVAILKKKIASVSEIEPDDQILKCNTTNGPVLANKKSLKDYGIENGTKLFLSLEFVEVIVEQK